MAALPAYTPTAPTTQLHIRELWPADAGLLDELYAGLSPRSRYQRFHAGKPSLSPRERAYLAGTDGRDHVAFVALDARGAPLAVARYVRLRDEPDTAEIAAEVLDAWQRQGLGSDLIARLAPRAAASGIRRFTAMVLSDTGLQRVLKQRGWSVASVDGATTTLTIDVWSYMLSTRTGAPRRYAPTASTASR